MKDEFIVKRYAEAFMDFVKDGIGFEKSFQDLKNLKNVVIHDNPEFLVFLNRQDISYSEKCKFIDVVLKDGFLEETRQFLKLLLDKRRIDKILDITEYIRVKFSHGKEVEALLKTSFPLDIELIKAIKEKLEHKFQKKLKLYIELDGRLLGGVQVIIGNTIIDGTIRGRLDALKSQLKAVRI